MGIFLVSIGILIIAGAVIGRLPGSVTTRNMLLISAVGVAFVIAGVAVLLTV
jgi:hypothetical protein